MYVFGQVAKNIKGFNFHEETKQILNQDYIQEVIIDFIQKRLYSKGETADGTILKTDKATFGSYSTYTEILKEKKNQITSNVTLKDSGKFYKSFKVEAQKAFIKISADFEKKNGNMQENFTSQYSNTKAFEDAIIDLNDKEKSIIVEKILLPDLIKRFLNKSLKY